MAIDIKINGVQDPAKVNGLSSASKIIGISAAIPTEPEWYNEILLMTHLRRIALFVS